LVNLPALGYFHSVPEVRPLPSTGITQFHRYYEPVRHPKRPGLSLAGVRLAVTHRHRWGFPCFVLLLCRRAVATAPVGPLGASIVHYPSDVGLPRAENGSAPTSCSFEACSAFTHVTAHQLADRPRRPFPPKAWTASLPPPPLRLLPARTIVAGRD